MPIPSLLEEFTREDVPAGLIFDDSRHYIDHLAPFCALLDWPLIVCEESIAKIARRFYPGLKITEINLFDLYGAPSTIVSCDSRGLIETACPISPKKLLWLPHGNSDKGWKGSFFSPLQGETVLVYGQKMIDFMHREQIFPQTISVGNFRLEYWLKHRLFYDTLLKETLSLQKARATYLYAPTWDDREGNGSLWKAFPLLASHLPEDCNLIVKIHPNTLSQHEPQIERWIGQYANRPNIYFLTEWPPIYPLLNLCDAYIGDMSSIGYDFLYWNRPMFFFNHNNLNSFLYRCGIPFTPETVASIFDKKYNDLEFKDVRKQVYAYTFDRRSE